MDLGTQLKVASAVASVSMADVDLTKVGKQDDPKAKFGLVESITYGGALGTVSLAIIVLAIFADFFVTYTAMGIALVVAPYVCFQRYQLSKMDTFRQVHNKLRKEVNRLQMENNELTNQVDRLEDQAKKVKDIEEGLSGVLVQQGEQVDTFVGKVKENGEILAKIEENLMWDVMQQIMGTVIRADVDNDFHIDDTEINMLLLRIKQIPGVEHIEEQEIRNLLAEHGNGLDAVVTFVRAIKHQTDNPPPKPDPSTPGSQKPRRKRLIMMSSRKLNIDQ